eukprot:s1188_g5.t1
MDFSPTAAYVKETLPGAAVKVGLWMRTAQMVTLVLSVAACSWGTIFWRKLSDLPNYSRTERPLMFNAEKLKNLSHLVLVAGHAVIMADSLEHVVQKESDWYLEPYQRHQDLPQALVSHIKSGVELTAADPEALLIFSGGQTRAAAGPRDEGWSYYRLAEHFSWWGHGGTSSQVGDRGALRGTVHIERSLVAGGAGAGVPVAQRTVTEDFALDSYQNLLFSFCRFKEVVGHYPQRVTVISFGFKKRRFAELHRAALRFPPSRFSFVGIQPPPGSRFDLARAEQGELQMTWNSWRTGGELAAVVRVRSLWLPFAGAGGKEKSSKSISAHRPLFALLSRDQGLVGVVWSRDFPRQPALDEELGAEHGRCGWSSPWRKLFEGASATARFRPWNAGLLQSWPDKWLCVMALDTF